MADQMADHLRVLNADDELNVIVIRGAGDAFCSGLDLTEFGSDPQPTWVATFGETWRSVHREIFDSPKIVVGALQRAAVNGGAALALACDFLIVGDESFLQVGEIQQGLAAPMNLAWLRLRHSEAVAARLLLLGDRVTGVDLERLGLAYRSVPDHDVLDAAAELAERFGAHDPTGVVRIKRSIRRVGGPESADEWLAASLASDPFGGQTLLPIAARDN